jgi:hypothetical protein
MKETSYEVEILVNINHPFFCLRTHYRFTTEELKKLFIQNITQNNVRYDDKYINSTYITPLRPIFSDLEMAIKEYESFIKYTTSYFEMDYIYANDVEEDEIMEYYYLTLIQENEKLKQENADLKRRLKNVNEIIM